MRDYCEACDSKKHVSVYAGSADTEIVACAACGLTWNRAMLDGREQAAYYATDYRSEFHDDLNASGFSRSFLVSMLTRAACLQEFLGDDLQPKMRHLDVGCGEGTFLAFSRTRGATVTGMELDTRLTRYAKQRYGLHVHQGTLEQVKLAPQSFDLVSLVHVVEHLPHPIATLTQVRPLLAPDARLLIEVPNLFRPWQKPSSFFFREHSFYFTPNSLRRIVAASGFKPLRLATSRRDGSLQLLAEPSRSNAVQPEWRDDPATIRRSILQNQLSYHLGMRVVRNKIHRLLLKRWAIANHGHLLNPSKFDELPAFNRAA
jgi:2-polyprenyl-3-methyl-5-hydroxy-6-metoxy-1,4-benzoquinol methylase